MRSPVRAVCALPLTALLILGCSKESSETLAIPSTRLLPGSMTSSSPFIDADVAITDNARVAMKITYTSTGPDGETTEVTGSAFVPRGKAPHGGWPVIAVAHESTGIGVECGPSSYADLLGSSTIVAGLLAMGHAVVLADYQGLGSPGGHPYLDAKVAGFNVIDSVRALRTLSPDISNRWVAYGASQGGGAAWAANERSLTYAPELRLLGAVSISPAADISALGDLAAAQALSPEQTVSYIWLLSALQQTRPGFDIDNYRSNFDRAAWNSVLSCEPEHSLGLQTLEAVRPDQLEPIDAQAQADLKDILTTLALPQVATASPMLIVFGGTDSLISAEWTRAAIEKACSMGSWIAAQFQPERGHQDLDLTAVSRWVADRFDGDPAPTTCSSYS